jgi:hypothetical protein
MRHSAGINTASLESLGQALPWIANAEVSPAVWTDLTPTANRAWFVPFRVYHPIIVTRLAYMVGAASSGNVDQGIYNRDGVRLVSSGSTAAGSTFTPQQFDVTDTVLGPGLYYNAIAFDNTTHRPRGYALAAATYGKMLGLAQMDTAFPLPATATFASYDTANVPFVSLLQSMTVLR